LLYQQYKCDGVTRVLKHCLNVDLLNMSLNHGITNIITLILRHLGQTYHDILQCKHAVESQENGTQKEEKHNL